MRSAWLVGGLSLLLVSAGCSCGNCGRGYPGGTYQQAATQQVGTPTAQYNMAGGTYASSQQGQPGANGMPAETGATATTASAMPAAGGSSTSLSESEGSVVR